MAKLDPAIRKQWKAALSSSGATWVACGVDLESGAPSSQLEGVPGLIDWIVHGQVSQLLQRGQLTAGECCVVAGDPSRGRPSFLLFPAGRKPNAASFAEKAKKLMIKDLCIAENTFSEDFLAKVKQTFNKEGIRCTKLELEHC